MSLITLDFETPYRTRADKKAGIEKYTLRSMTYEEYIRDPRFRVMGLGVKIDQGETKFWRYGNIEQVLRDLFFDGNDHILLCHNTMFDAAILSWHFGLRPAVYWDTQSMSNALWPQAPASLDKLTQRLFPKDRSKWKGKELASFDGKWPEDMTEEDWETYAGYCIQDVDITFAAFMEMYKFFPRDELALIDMTIRMFAEPLLQLDAPRVEEYYEQLLEKRTRLVRESGVSQSLLASNGQFADYLKVHHGIVIPEIPSPTLKNPANTKLATGKSDLEFVEIRKAHPELDHIWDARIAVKSTGEINRCQRLLIHTDNLGRIAVPLKFYGAHTGRYSGTNKVNFQNFKRGSPLRLALTAPRGHKVVVRDLSNIEGRTNAWFNQQWDKCQAFAEGRDLYNELASDIFGYPVDRKAKVQDAQGNYLNKEGNIVVDKDDAAYLQWTEGFVGKTAELGLGYQMGAPKFRAQCAILGDILFEQEFCENVVRIWRTKNYKIQGGWKLGEKAIFDMAQRGPRSTYEWNCLTVDRGRLVLPNGLALVYPKLELAEENGRHKFEYWNGKYMKSLYGGLLMENIIQALARIILTGMMLEIDKRARQMGGRVVLTVHDEIVVVVPDQHATELYDYMGEVMATPPGWANDGYLALASEGGIADNYSK